MSRAFTPNQLVAVAAVPTAVVSLVPYLVRRAVYESGDGNGMVIYARHRPILDLVLAVPSGAVLLSGLWAFVTFAVGFGPGGVVVGWGTVAFVLIGGLAMTSTSNYVTATGPETPPGDRFIMMGLAQRAGTTTSALLLARTLIRRTPSGAVVVTRAANNALADGYERLGFTRGTETRLYLTT